MPNAGRLSEAELRRIEDAEAAAYEELFAAAASRLGTGSARIQGALALWYPAEGEAGYNGIVNFHRADDLEFAYEVGLGHLLNVGAPVFGIPVDNRIATWATPERLDSLGLKFESTETIWSRRVEPSTQSQVPGPPLGFTVEQSQLDRDELARSIDIGWDAPVAGPRGELFSHAKALPGWRISLARHDGEIAGVSMLCVFEQVGILMLSVVMPAFRGRGLQGFFIEQRLAEAGRRGCTLAISETDSENASPRNLQRAGFELLVRRQLYSRALPDRR